MTDVYICDCLTIDMSNYPIALLTAHDIDPDDEQVEKCLELIDQSFGERNGSFCVLADGSNVKWLSAWSRVLLAKGYQAIEAKYSDRFQFTVIVVPNPIVNMLVNGFNLIAQPVLPQYTTKTIEEAYKVIETNFQLNPQII